jgi:hypothetical protein
VHTVDQSYQSRSIGSHFYSVNAKILYWEYEAIATVYKGFGLSDITSMSVRQRDFWYRMAKWRTSAH